MKISKDYFLNWVHNSYSIDAKTLGFIRIVFGAAYLFILGMYHFEWVGKVAYPTILFNPPPSAMSFFKTFPPELIGHFFNFSTSLLAFFVMVGYKTRFSSILLGVFIILGFTTVVSFGKILHLLLYPYTAIMMSFTNWGSELSLDKKFNSKRNTKNPMWPLTYLSLIIAFAYFTSGFSKVLGGWFLTDYQAVKWYFLYEYFVTQRTDLLANVFIGITSSLFWEFMDWYVVFIETIILLSILKPNYFRFFLANILAMHIGVFFILNINFTIFIVVFLPFIDWSKLSFPKSKYWIKMLYYLENIFFKIKLIHILIIYFFYMLIFYWRGYDSWLEMYSPEYNAFAFVVPFVLIFLVWQHLKIRK